MAQTHIANTPRSSKGVDRRQLVTQMGLGFAIAASAFAAPDLARATAIERPLDNGIVEIYRDARGPFIIDRDAAGEIVGARRPFVTSEGSGWDFMAFEDWEQTVARATFAGRF